MNEAVEERATVIAEGGAPIGVDLELVLSSGILQRPKDQIILLKHWAQRVIYHSKYSNPERSIAN